MLDNVLGPKLSEKGKFAGGDAAAAIGMPISGETARVNWRSSHRTGFGTGVHLLRQPRYPRNGESRRPLRPVALRPRLSAGLPNAADYAQSL